MPGNVDHAAHFAFVPLGHLDASGELDDCASPLNSPVPDLSALARFYGAFASECFEKSEGS